MADLIQYVIVGLIVLAAAWSVARRYVARALPRALRARLFGAEAAAAGGCDSGCGSCKSGCESPAQPELHSHASGQSAGNSQRVIRLHPR